MNNSAASADVSILHTTVQALSYAGIEKYPIDLIDLVRPVPNLKTCSYERFAENHRLTVREVCAMLGSDYGTYVSRREMNQHVIYYHKTVENQGLLRFTIAHELAHFYLLHADKMRVKRLSYQKAEAEANFFARNLLAPVPLVQRVLKDDTFNFENISLLMRCFHISCHAAKIRLVSLEKDWGACRRTSGYLDFFQGRFEEF